MTADNTITDEMIDCKIAWCEQNLFWGSAAKVQKMTDFYFEKARDSVDQDWPESFDGVYLAQVLNVERVSYRIYYSRDNLTLRLFVFLPHCTYLDEQKMLDMGFVIAKPGDTDNIPDKPVEQIVEEIEQ
jgi:hypothetical protein